MHRFPALLLGLGVGALLLVGIGLTDALAEELARTIDEIGIKRPLVNAPLAQRASLFSTSQPDTIWVGYHEGSRDAGNPYGVDCDGIWDFEFINAPQVANAYQPRTQLTGSDTTMFWSFYLLHWRSESTTALPLPTDRPMWYFDHGNEVNIGDTNLWLDRETRGMQSQIHGDVNAPGTVTGIDYLRTGITGYWHNDTMAGVSTPIAGAQSAWCGLRGPNDFSYLDPVTGNPLNGDLARYWTFGGALINGSWPGYGNQIDQMMYHDVQLTGNPATDVLSFKFRTDLSDAPATENNGTGWFQPNPLSIANLVLTPAPAGPVDSLIVWAGLPTEAAYDVNKRWLSEVLDFNTATQPVQLFRQHGRAPLVGNDSTVTEPLPALGAGTVVRVVFQVKTNRQFSDETFDLHGFDSAEGAALIDDVIVAGQAYNFEGNEIKPRYPLPGGGVLGAENSPLANWITTGKPPAGYGHVDNIQAAGLPYNDPCGALGSPDRLCDVIGNVVMLSNHDDPDHAFYRESWVGAESPTIDLSPGSDPVVCGVGDANHDLFRLEYQLWTGEMDLDQSVFWNVGARYWGPTFLQQADNLVPGWSDNIVAPFIAFNPDPACVIFNSDTDLDGIIPPPSQLDSLKVFVWTQTRCARFGATVLCGKPEGGYFDHIRAAFTGGEGAAVTAQFWDLLADTFPFNEAIAPGTIAFDTTTALIKCGLNNAASSGGEGVIVGDSLSVISAFINGAGNNTRLDLLFRVKPGPGNYSTKGDPNTPLLKVPSNPGLGNSTPNDGSWFGEYMGDPGPFSKGNHSAGWDWTTWNSARMDSADNGNISPLEGRELGIPVDDAWEGTYHELDPNGGTGAPLAIVKNLCFLVDPAGSVNELNVCCSAAQCGAAPFFESWPPSAYPIGTPTTTDERTKILTDGLFTPGTHIEYIMRRSDTPPNGIGGGATGISVTPDTTVASQQAALGPHFDGQRYLEIGVFPDMWKDVRFGGDGLACMLVVDGGDRRGQEDTVIGGLDSLGYGKNNGAGRGWWEDDPSTSNPDPDDPDNWVFPNLGQKGLSFDWFDIQASESAEADRPGCRLAVAPPSVADRQCKQGPTPDMLKHYYNTILWMADDLETGVLHDGIDDQEQSDDVALVQDFLATSAAGSERAFYLAADGAANDLANSFGAAPTLLSNFFAAVLDAEDYRVASQNLLTPALTENLIAEFSIGQYYGYNNSCLLFPDVVSVNGGVAGGQLAQRYEDSSDGNAAIAPGTYGSAVYRPADNVSRFYSTLITGYQVPNLLGDGARATQTDAGRQHFLDRALTAFNLCQPIGPTIGIISGDGPAVNVNFVRGSFPNPSISGRAQVRFSLAQPAKVTIRFYNVAGRLVHEQTQQFDAGSHHFDWSGQNSTGMRSAPGVYFYRLSAPGIEFQNNSQRMVLLGQK